MARLRNPNALLIPAAVVLIVLTAVSLLRLIVGSLFARSLTAPADTDFAWFRNFIAVLTAGEWWLAIALTLVVVTVAVVIQLLLAAAFAASLRRITIGGPWLHVLLLLPLLVSPAAAAWAWRDGWTVGFAPVWFHYTESMGQLAGLMTILSHEVWRGTGITTIILLAGLSQLKPALIDSAIADGATPWQRLTRIVLPAAGPAIGVAILYRSLDALRAVEAPVLASSSLGQLSTASQMVWDTSFTTYELGLGAAMSLVLLVLAAGLALLLMLLLRVGRAT
jgi:multiple sugar transport system permease protein